MVSTVAPKYLPLIAIHKTLGVLLLALVPGLPTAPFLLLAVTRFLFPILLLLLLVLPIIRALVL